MAQLGIGRSVPPAEDAASATIPDKLYFRIGEVAALCGVPTYVLRFWESEFPQLKPNKGGTGQRLYRRRDVEMALRIRSLLYEGKYTIPGARQALRTEQRQPEPQLSLAIVEPEGARSVDRKGLRRLQTELRELLELVSGPVTTAGATVQSIRGPRTPKAARVRASSSDELFS